jgi:phosphoribosylamine-glycine ligase
VEGSFTTQHKFKLDEELLSYLRENCDVGLEQSRKWVQEGGRMIMGIAIQTHLNTSRKRVVNSNRNICAPGIMARRALGGNGVLL